MQLPLRSLFAVTTSTVTVLTIYPWVLRFRDCGVNHTGLFWIGFGLDLMLAVLINAWIITFFASLSPEQRKEIYGRYRYIICIACVAIPFFICLNVVIGHHRPTGDPVFHRVYESYNEIFSYGFKYADWITIAWSLLFPFILGLATTFAIKLIYRASIRQ